MALVKADIKNSILTVLNSAEAKALNGEDSKDVFADKLAEAIISAIKSQSFQIIGTDSQAGPLNVTTVTIT